MLISSCDALRPRVRQLLSENAYPGYVYGYPHKKAYRWLPHPVPLSEAWEEEDRGALFCYVHLPFCNQRCSFCNLFTYVPGETDPATTYLNALAREMEAYERALRPFSFARLYVGGGTPTFLSAGQLATLTRNLRDILGVDVARASGCIEASPETLDEDKVQILRESGFQRLSLGIQSLVPQELRAVNRRFDFEHNQRAIDRAGQAGFPQFNIDLIYGLPGQTLESWAYSLDTVLASRATSLFLYPLYIRPLTGLDRRAEALPCPAPRQMGAMYDHALDRLGEAGFHQITMRQFRRDQPGPRAGHDYRCQEDGMVGLGAGARSYTRALHYSTPWKMVARNIRAVVEDYITRMNARETDIRYGFRLDEEEQRRRFLILSLLYDGFDFSGFSSRFGVDARVIFADLLEVLLEEQLVIQQGERMILSKRGTRHADIVGQICFSARVQQAIDSFEYDRVVR
jgi:oxygen-independent coproporphyrinogen-3 oxidase